ncbi:DEHA2F07546p [Debaryomyces hansenii CBS767]|uniref:DEHA2F07546p n=1 Tax=Debaryomyces hansenii (strain ATCC 36239 / CBS 767 / BCRC 21394 / JCM 1990 / NBRC 0083 / IGC 2968) TaxID=284592 RepID=Q6BM85_DEBHA|nr:DEHA2F07546p [Debaryomyces hansenii CBS767]CAG89023.2 DEHA2F07546p [Debaryomyces hansenii CBS767]|eukprot:XP_460686.2 DEHA2F07546p [Debaryomyces hansenii CBS767]
MRFTRVLRQAEEVLVKAASGNPTGLTGIYQHPNPRPALIALYNHTLTVLDTKFPKESVYKQSVEALTRNRLKVVQEEEITENIENKIGGGLIEEIIIQAHEELGLANDLSSLKCWEELEEKPLDDQWVYFGKKI